jgi:hypothetical protein
MEKPTAGKNRTVMKKKRKILPERKKDGMNVTETGNTPPVINIQKILNQTAVMPISRKAADAKAKGVLWLKVKRNLTMNRADSY